MICGTNGFLVVTGEFADASPTTISCPSDKLSATTAVFAPSETPVFTSIGRTNSPSFNQMVPGCSLEPLPGLADLESPAAELAGGSAGSGPRASGAGLTRAGRGHGGA